MREEAVMMFKCVMGLGLIVLICAIFTASQWGQLLLLIKAFS